MMPSHGRHCLKLNGAYRVGFGHAPHAGKLEDRSQTAHDSRSLRQTLGVVPVTRRKAVAKALWVE